MFIRNAARSSLCPHNTCANDLLDLDICRVHLPGKFSDGLAGVLVCGWVDVILHPKPCGCMVCIRREWHKAGLPTHHRHALLLAKTVPRSSPQPWGIPALPGVLLARAPSFCLCTPPPQPPHLGCCTVAVALCSLSDAASCGTNQCPGMTLPFPPTSAPHTGCCLARDLRSEGYRAGSLLPTATWARGRGWVVGVSPAALELPGLEVMRQSVGWGHGGKGLTSGRQ